MSLHDILVRRIAAQGPISVADYMAECLLHPEHGYYTTRAPFGAAGDFTTAPEISQMFGELLGLCMVQCWVDQGQPKPFTLAELGPGRGTLLADALRAARAVPSFLQAAEIVLVEASPKLRSGQADTLRGHAPAWADDVADLPQQPLFLIANEFFDALPVRQYQRDASGWRERNIGLQDGQLTFGLGPILPQPALAERLEDTRDGDIVEYAPAAAPVIDGISQRIRDHGGAALIIDYGDWRSLGDTLQAIQSHDPVDPLVNPGRADLTAHVDFEALAKAVLCAHTRLTTQGVFLERLGITARAQALAKSLSGEALNTHVAAHRRLTHPDEMGNLFKVLGLFPADATPPPGLEL
jgi:SAM-dependent MidA family methyltransferase